MNEALLNTKIVCLGGGIGTSNLLKGLKSLNPDISVITSMADDGGSSGRLRKAYNIMPPGDIISCIAAMIPDTQNELSELLTYRFPGNNSKVNKSIDGHKLGNLIMLAEIQRTGDFHKAVEIIKKLFGVKGNFLPATEERTHLTGITNDGRRIHSETTLDLAKYSQPYGLKKIYLTPKKPKVNERVIKSILEAEIILSGPGDLYTNQLPVLIIPQIREAIINSKARKKVFIVNITNKPFETRKYTVKDFVNAVSVHMEAFPFDTVLVNNNISNQIPKKFRYEYVPLVDFKTNMYTLIEADVVFDTFPLYHDSHKLARAINRLYNSEA